jgi:CheY-like chemotaxis protein
MSSPTSSLRVLLVDDDDGLRAVLAEALVELGCVVAQSVATAAEAIVLVNAGRAGDVAFVDVNLGSIGGGYEAAARACAAGMSVVAMTGGHSVPEGFPGQALLVKPFSLDGLRQVVRAIVATA